MNHLMLVGHHLTMAEFVHIQCTFGSAFPEYGASGELVVMLMAACV